MSTGNKERLKKAIVDLTEKIGKPPEEVQLILDAFLIRLGECECDCDECNPKVVEFVKVTRIANGWIIAIDADRIYMASSSYEVSSIIEKLLLLNKEA